MRSSAFPATPSHRGDAGCVSEMRHGAADPTPFRKTAGGTCEARHLTHFSIDARSGVWAYLSPYLIEPGREAGGAIGVRGQVNPHVVVDSAAAAAGWSDDLGISQPVPNSSRSIPSLTWCDGGTIRYTRGRPGYICPYLIAAGPYQVYLVAMAVLLAAWQVDPRVGVGVYLSPYLSAAGPYQCYLVRWRYW